MTKEKFGVIPFPIFDWKFPGLGRTPGNSGALYIYVLVDSRDNTVRYVGSTRRPKKRELDHRINNKRKKRSLSKWKRTDPNFKFILVDRG
jgi:hypothetical protein